MAAYERETTPAAVSTPDLCILGGGPGGIALAAGAAACGASVTLIEQHRLGGVSLSYGTVPARTLTAAADVAAAIRTAGPLAVGGFEPIVDWRALATRIRETVATLAADSSAERLTGLGVRVVQAAGRFVDPTTVVAAEYRIAARATVIATGSAIALPDIPGLAATPHLTTDTVFDVRTPIDHLIVVGAGAAGTELAQIYRRLGCRVTLIERAGLLRRFDPELVAVVRARLVAEGVVLHENAEVTGVVGASGRVVVEFSSEGRSSRADGSHLLIAGGRRPNVADIGLDLAKVAVGPDGVTVDARLRTSNPRVHALGDVTGHPYSVQRAEYHARQLLANLVLGQSLRIDPRRIPWAVYTDPELAAVGLLEAEARSAHGRIEAHRYTLRDTVRAVVARETAGHVKVVTDRAGRILGASIVGRGAAELIHVWSLAISKDMSLTDMAGSLVPHPTLGEASRKVTLHRYAEMTGHAAGRAWRRLLARLG